MRGEAEVRHKGKYRISVTQVNSRQPLIFTVDEYKIIDGTLIQFYDSYKNKTKIFDSRCVEIEFEGEEKDGDKL